MCANVTLLLTLVFKLSIPFFCTLFQWDNKAVLEPRVSPDFAITYFCNHCNIRFENTDQSMWIHWPFFPKTWTKGHWPLDDLWPHVCWGHMCDSTQGSLCPSPMTIHQCMWIQWSILQNTTYIHTGTHTTYILHTYYVQNEWSHSLLLNSVQARQKLKLFSSTFLEKLSQNCQWILEIISHKTLTRTNISVPSVISVLL